MYYIFRKEIGIGVAKFVTVSLRLCSHFIYEYVQHSNLRLVGAVEDHFTERAPFKKVVGGR